uniref:CARD domain-containing protein n=1 Tax=Sinocyclocheilus rhinocerous TaxID=307959 RepID=A0A673JAV2_9TELE
LRLNKKCLSKLTLQRVSLVEPIADDMKPLIGDEKYQTILNSETPQDKMRKLLNFLTTTKLKDKLYQTISPKKPWFTVNL